MAGNTAKPFFFSGELVAVSCTLAFAVRNFNDYGLRAHDALQQRARRIEVYVDDTGRAARSFPARWPLLALDRIYCRTWSVRHPLRSHVSLGSVFQTMYRSRLSWCCKPAVKQRGRFFGALSHSDQRQGYSAYHHVLTPIDQ